MSSIKPWAKLLTLNKLQAQTVELTEKQVSIGRLDSNSIKLQDSRVSSKHCIIEYDEGVCYLTDLSTNGTFVNGSKVGKGSKIVIENGSEIHLLTEGPKVPASEVISYAFMVLEQPKTLQPQKPEPDPPVQKQIKLDYYFDEFTCTICSDILYQPISVIPCLHTFCGGCFSTWVKKEPTCPNCRKPVDSARKNAQLQNLLEIYLQENPDKRRPQEELDRMNRENDIKEEKVFKKEAPKVPQQIQQRPLQFGQFGQFGHPLRLNNFSFGVQQPNLQNPLFRGLQPQLLQPQPLFAPGLNQADHVWRPWNQQNEDEDNEDENEDSGSHSSRSDDYSSGEEGPMINFGRGNFRFDGPFGNLAQPPINNVIQMNQAANNRNCLWCEGRFDIKCPIGQAHVACQACHRLMPNRNLSEEENEVLKHKCQFCQSHYCNLVNPNCLPNPRVSKLMNVQQLHVVRQISVDTFRGNRFEYSEFIKKAQHKTHQTIIQFMLENYIQPGLFFVQIDQKLYPKPQHILDFQLTEETPFCTHCAQVAWTEIFIRYCYDKRPNCQYGFNCRAMKNNVQHQQFYNHLCEQTQF